MNCPSDHPLIANSLPRVVNDQPAGLLRVSGINPRYFVRSDDTLKAVYLTGSHTWSTGNDIGRGDPPPVHNFRQFLDFMSEQGHNFTRLWYWEQSKGVSETTIDYRAQPHVYKRTGPGNALDGKPKFNLDSLDELWFRRIHSRADSARLRGFYVSMMLFDGWSVSSRGDVGNPWGGHPMNASNNVNGINGDTNGDGNGEEAHSLSIPAIRNLHIRYVKRMIDELNDVDNIIWEISNESSYSGSLAWQRAMIDTIRNYEMREKPKQHPTWFTGDWWITNSQLFNSNASAIAPGAGPNGDLWQTSPPDMGGAKIIIADTDHLWGLGGDRIWVWKCFTRGANPIFMDRWNDEYEIVPGGYDSSNVTDVSFRLNMGYTLTLANRINLLKAQPQGQLASTGYCLANPSASDAEYLVYRPTSSGSISVDLTASPGTLNVEWFRPGTGQLYNGGTTTGGTIQSFSAPFTGDAVLYIFSSTVTAPGPPTLASPPNLSTGVVTSPILTWTTAMGADTYAVQVGLDSSFSVIIVSDSLLIDTTRQASGLSTGTTYYWRVRGTNTQGNSPWSSVWSFTTISLPPSAPVLIEPLDLSLGQPLSPILTWSRVFGADSYDVQLSSDPVFSSLILNDSLLVDTTQQASGLNNGAIYFWRVRSRNVAGLSGWPVPWSFTTTIQLPGQVQLVSPADEAALNSDTVSFVWHQSSPGITNYWIEGSTDSLFSQSLMDSTLTDTTTTVPGVPVNTTYYWRVKAKNSIGWGQFSSTRSFTVRVSAVSDPEVTIPSQIRLEQNYPNPFNPETIIRFSLPTSADVYLDVYTIQGKKIATLAQGLYSPGWHSVRWDGMTSQGVQASSGVYLYSLRAGTKKITKKLLLLR